MQPLLFLKKLLDTYLIGLQRLLFCPLEPFEVHLHAFSIDVNGRPYLFNFAPVVGESRFTIVLKLRLIRSQELLERVSSFTPL